MTAADWQPIIQAIIALIAAVFTGLIGIYVPRAIAAFEKRTGVAVTDQERAAIQGAITTAAGILQTKLDQGVIKIADITPSSAAVVGEANKALDRVPTSAANQGTTPAVAAAMIVARVDTSPRAPVVALPAGPALVTSR